MKPLIGISAGEEARESAYVSLNAAYVRAVAAAGGLPLLIPPAAPGDDPDEYARECAGRLDGLLLSGGGDILPGLFGEPPLPGVSRISETRDLSELALVRAARDRRVPVLGICRGCQVLAVALGGTLYQDIPTQLPRAHGHYPQNTAMDELYHDIEIEDSRSRIAKALGAGRVRTNSFHHQAVRDPGEGLAVTARSADGVIEAIEGTDPGRFLLGVRFHPEALTPRHPRFAELFRSFVEAAVPAAGESGP